MRHSRILFPILVGLTAGSIGAAEPADIKAYCLDFNWGGRGRLANPGQWRDADPAAHVAWHKQVGTNVIQTFCVSTNGYAWYTGGPVPEQPGLKHDFLRRVVKLAHAEGMKVFGYFTVGSNPRWGGENPDHYYEGGRYNIVYSDAYLAYLSAAVGDAVKTTGIDGFMIDWVWMPHRKTKQNPEGKWVKGEKQLYEQLMGEPFPGEEKLTRDQDLAYSRKAIDRCWQTIRKAAKDANPNCIIWLTSNSMTHPHVVNSDMYRQVDWLMCEVGSMDHIRRVKSMVGPHTRLITCMAQWNGADPTRAVPEAREAGVGLYGFAKPRNGVGTIPLDNIFSSQVTELSGDDQNIAVLARSYHGASLHATWQEGRFVEPDSPPAFDLRFKRRGRGWQDTGRIDTIDNATAVTITTPYRSGRAQLSRTADGWPATVKIRLLTHPQRDAPNVIRMANGKVAFAATLDSRTVNTFGAMEGEMTLSRPWGDKFAVEARAGQLTIETTRTDEYVEFTVPAAITATNPQTLVFEWAVKPEDRIR